MEVTERKIDYNRIPNSKEIFLVNSFQQKYSNKKMTSFNRLGNKSIALYLFILIFQFITKAKTQTVISKVKTYQDVVLPPKENNWRNIEQIPYVWLDGTLRYALFNDQSGQRIITV